MTIDLLTYKLSDLYNNIDQHKAFEWYLQIPVRIGRAFNNPLREDNVASASLVWKGKVLVMVDFANSLYSGDMLRIVMNNEKIGYKEAYKKIWRVLMNNKEYARTVEVKTIDKEVTLIFTKPREWNESDLKYFSDQGIDITLEKDVSACSAVRIGERVYYDDHMYAYDCSDGIYEIYRPFAARGDKFRYNGHRRLIFGWNELPDNGDLLIITKSKKDRIFLKQRGYTAICKTGEGVTWEEHIIKALQTRFKRIVAFYDRDAQGMRNVRSLWKKYKTDFFFINKKWGVKDITDFYKKYGQEQTKQLLQWLNGEQFVKR